MAYYLTKNHKPYGHTEPMHTFIVHYHNKSLDILIPSKSTVKDLNDIVKIKYSL